MEVSELKFHIAPLSDFIGIVDRFRNIRQNPAHFLFRFQIKLIVRKAHPVGIADISACLNAQKDIVKFRILPIDIVNVVGCHQTDAGLTAQLLQHRIDPRFLLQPLILNFKEKISLSKDAEIFQRFFPGAFIIPADESLLHSAGDTGAGGDNPSAVCAQHLIIDPRFIIKAFRITPGDYFYQISIALIRLGEKDEMTVSLVLFHILIEAGTGRRIDLTADDRLNPRFFAAR